MSFFHAYLLGGLSLITVPILIHLVTRDKPKLMRFPAFRFLRAKYHTNRRKLRVHNLLLLLLRMLLIAALVLALTRPRLYSDRLTFLGGNQPVVVVLLFDTSPSMGYERGGITRLEDARKRALELLEELPDGSRIALFDSAHPPGEFTTRDEVRKSLKSLDVLPANGPISRLLPEAFRKLEEEDGSSEGANEPPPRYLYVFSDRTRPSWDPGDVRNLKPPEGISMVYVDVGVEKPTDLAIEQLQIEPPAVTPGGTVRVRAVVRATGEKAERKITCQIDNDPRPQERIVQLEEGARQSVSFEFRAANTAKPQEGGLPPGPHQVTIRLEGTDRLPFNNVRHGTFDVRPGRKVLTIVDQADDEQPWTIALPFLGFTSTVRSLRNVEKLSLKEFDLVCLHQVSDPAALWAKLATYVEGGGQLAVIPGGPEMQKGSYNEARGGLLPARLDRLVPAPTEAGLIWNWSLGNASPLMAPFLRWRREQSDIEFNKTNGQPRIYRYWEVTPMEKEQGTVIERLTDDRGPPVILERPVGQGRVLLFTTLLDAKEAKIFADAGLRPSTNYWQNSFGFVLIDKVCRYLAGDSVTPDFNYVCGQVVAIPLPREGGDKYLLLGPGLPPQGSPLSIPRSRGEEKEPSRFLPISQVVEPGNYLVYTVRADRQEVLEGFSLDVRSDESLLLPRVPKEQIEEVLGKESVLDMEHGLSLREAFSKKPQPVELLPWLMLALLVFLACENVLANRRREAKPAAPTPVPDNTAAAVSSWRPTMLVLLWTALGAVIGAALGLGSNATGSLLAGAFVAGLVGLFHGLLGVACFGPRDSAILGGLLGSKVGVLAGWLLLGGTDTTLGVLFGMTAGAAVLAADGWVLGLRSGAKS